MIRYRWSKMCSISDIRRHCSGALVLILVQCVWVSVAQQQQQQADEGADLCGTDLPLTVQYRDLPPLLTRYNPDAIREIRVEEDGSTPRVWDHGIMGMFHEILWELLHKCCNGREKELKYGKSSTSTVEMHGTMRNYTFTMPVSLSTTDMEHLRVVQTFKFLPLLPSPGVLIIGRDDSRHAMIDVIFQAWPLFLMIIGMTLTSGVIIWFLDRNKNSEQFPKKFLTGWLEGVWWAFVSMTTVGYGDIAPRSIPARIFGIIWILIGICIISIFTSIVTAALTSESTSGFNVRGMKAGVLRHSDELMTALSNGADPKWIESITEIKEKVDNGTIDVAIVEQFVAGAHLAQLKKSGLSMMGKLPQNRIFGILLWNISDDLYDCFSQNVLLNEQTYTATVMDNVGRLQKEGDKSIELISEIFDTYGYIPIYVAVGLFLLFFILFLIWEFVYRRPKARRKKLKTKPQLEAFLFDESLEELQIRQTRERANLEAELQDYTVQWNDRLKLQALKHKCERDEYAKRNMPTLIHTLK